MLNIIYIFSRFICFILVRVFFRLKVFYRYRIPRKGALIIASNHASFLDPVILGVVSPRVLNFIARDDLFLNRFFGTMISFMGAFPIKREGGSSGAFKEALKRLKEQKALVIFPEGTRTKNGSLGKAHSGVGFLAARSEGIVIPVYIDGSDSALPRRRLFIRFKPIKVYFGKPLGYKDTTKIERRDAYQTFSDLVMENILVLKSNV
ncbi:MAG: 1-acyl-sn-glycerol-3-phosphate acyltransferase [Candidatus Omnitrophica bacterium]|nr:1-acyl-sn-glycerol-3-phosphate acyltransferase [Candidatus Omnitrophota bacterium]